ncbi:peroxisomal membrane protein 4 [Skeletonema marinoi]|uniref:Peroxisomal membrane protein 4 n=1 Tax=Skeletonema marinoi TaxID=267567 RepID=A0AAD9DCB5_9STRA|nr:peroxisomal membrane protein 4 [Skeletonema marinoi]
MNNNETAPHLIDAATNHDSLHTISSTTSAWDEVAAIISGLIGGGRYGLKIRIPHAFVMTFLFGNKLPFRRKLQVIAKLAAEHSINLASFACLYKFLLASLKVLSRLIPQNDGSGDASVHSGILRRLIKSVVSMVINGPFSSSLKRTINPSVSTPAGIPQHPYHAFLAGAVGGYIVWGRYSSVNYQLILYLASRILVGCIKLAREKGIRPFSWKKLKFANSYPYGAAVIWGTVMMLFEEYPEVLHPSLRRSMDEIYRFASFGYSSSSVSDVLPDNRR